LLRCNDEIYLTRRDPKKGKLDLAGGFVDPKESAEETCKRELFEELQLDVDISNLKYLPAFQSISTKRLIIDLFYEYRVPEKFEVNLELSEISEAVWIPLKELNLEDIAFDSQKKFFEEYLKNI
jgi:ADP-ribose pyrophosphatase YjhB (NUDIX family)